MPLARRMLELHVSLAPENIWKKGELKELSESTGHRKIMFPDIGQIQCVKQLYRDLISINIYFAFFSILFKYNVKNNCIEISFL